MQLSSWLRSIPSVAHPTFRHHKAMNPDARQSAHGIASNSWSQLRLGFLQGFCLAGRSKTSFPSEHAFLSSGVWHSDQKPQTFLFKRFFTDFLWKSARDRWKTAFLFHRTTHHQQGLSLEVSQDPPRVQTFEKQTGQRKVGNEGSACY